ncbi:MAG: transposase [Coleofasciculus sp. C2-GNP5-27]
MKFDPQKHHRRSIRLKGYNYAEPGAYFITICTYQRQCWFGNIRDGKMYLNQIGKIVAQEWINSGQIRPSLQLEQWVIMPNHVHGIVIITDTNTVGAHRYAPLPTPQNRPSKQSVIPPRKPRSLSSFVAGFKSAVTIKINTIRQTSNPPIWQRNYYESILREQDSLNTVRQYIIHNPQQWMNDPENPLLDSNNQQLLIDLPF